MTKLLGISGSLRKASFNKALLQAALPLAPQGVTFNTGTIEGIPALQCRHRGGGRS